MIRKLNQMSSDPLGENEDASGGRKQEEEPLTLLTPIRVRES